MKFSNVLFLALLGSIFFGCEQEPPSCSPEERQRFATYEVESKKIQDGELKSWRVVNDKLISAMAGVLAECDPAGEAGPVCRQKQIAAAAAKEEMRKFNDESARLRFINESVRTVGILNGCLPAK